MRRVACLAVLGLLLAVPTAAAQDAQPIRGGGGFNDAPRLRPGSYTDSIRIGETLHYAVAVGEGQQVTARATAALVARDPAEAYFLEGQLYSPLRSEVSPQDLVARQAQRNKSGPMNIELMSPTASAESEVVPGLWYVTVELDRTEFFRRPPKRQFDLRLEIDVPGAAQGTGPPLVRNGPPPGNQQEALEPRASGARPNGEAPGTAGAEGPDLLVLALAAVGGLAGGLILGAGAMALRGRSRSRAA